MTNNNILRTATGGTLQVERFVTQDPTSGFIVAEDGGIVKLTGSGRVAGGRLLSNGSGVFHAGDNMHLVDVNNQVYIEVRPVTSVGRMLIKGAGLTEALRRSWSIHRPSAARTKSRFVASRANDSRRHWLYRTQSHELLTFGRHHAYQRGRSHHQRPRHHRGFRRDSEPRSRLGRHDCRNGCSGAPT